MARSNTPQLIAGILVLFGIVHYLRGRDLSANADNAEDNFQADNPPPLLDGSNGGGGGSEQSTPEPSPQNYDITYNNTYNQTQGRTNPRAADPTPTPTGQSQSRNTFGGIPVPANYSGARDYFSQLRNSLTDNNNRFESQTKVTSLRGSSRSSSRNSFNSGKSGNSTYNDNSGSNFFNGGNSTVSKKRGRALLGLD